MDIEFLKLLGTPITIQTPPKPTKKKEGGIVLDFFYVGNYTYGGNRNLQWDTEYIGFEFDDIFYISFEISPDNFVYFKYEKWMLNKAIIEYGKPQVQDSLIREVFCKLYDKVEALEFRLNNV